LEDVEALPANATVVRFGLLTVESFRESLEIEQVDSGRNGLSVYVCPGATVAETCATAGLPHRRIRTSTVGELAQEGFNVVPDGPDGHSLVLVDDASDATWARLNALFSGPLLNPARGG
jgi:hypothetical protein